MTHCIWFRNDLRLSDNTALSHACRDSDDITAVFIVSMTMWQQHHHESSAKIDFMLRQLQSLNLELADYGVRLHILQVEHYDDIPMALSEFAKQQHIQAIYANREYLYNESQRDHACAKTLEAIGVTFTCFDDRGLMPPQQITKADGSAYKVFTPYKRAFLNTLTPQHYCCDTIALKPNKAIAATALKLPQLDVNNAIKQHWPAGEKAAQQRLNDFIDSHIKAYQQQRDFPSIDGTSQLSAYLAIGALSSRQCLSAICEAHGVDDIHALLHFDGIATWVSELIWREFYTSICCHFPNLVKGAAFKPDTDRLPWRYNQNDFHAWSQGQTGFPIVDAFMRQLNQTGWMHNRGRMITAMFLSKTLFIDWRWGERYFIQQLIDGDFAANNGGWQWSASTGTDSVPYFRIFNPTTQSQRFDADGDFIRQYCPELAHLNNKQIHQPNATQRFQAGYPEPIVDYSAMRKLVIEAFKNL